MGNLTNSHLKVTDNPPGLQTLTSITDTDISDVADALNFLCSALEANKTVRVLLNALIGLLAGRSTVIEFYHFDLGKRMYGSGYIPPPEFKKHKEQVEAKVSDAMAQLQDWSAIWRLPIKYTPGKKTETGEKIPSSIKTPILSWVSEIVDLAREIQTGESEKSRSEAYRQATAAVLKKKKISRKKRKETRAKKERDSGTEYQAVNTFSDRFIAKKIEETQKDPAELIDWFVWYLGGRLKQKYCRMDVQNPPLPADLAPGEIPLDEYGQELTPDPQILQVYSVAVDHQNPASVIASDEGSQGIIDIPPVTLCAPENEIIEDSSAPIESDLLQELEGLPGYHFEALRACLSVDATPEMVLFKNDQTRQVKETKTNGRKFASGLCSNLGKARETRQSFIVGLPRNRNFIQVDDADPATVERLRSFSFLTIETSPKNYQCWLAIAGNQNTDQIRRRLFEGLKRANLNGNQGATWALRWPGSINFKPNRQQFMIRVESSQPGRRVTVSELEASGLLPELSDQQQQQEQTSKDYSKRGYVKQWPDYEKCLRAKPSRSEADAQFTSISLKRGFTLDEIISKLDEVSERAQQSGRKYIERTVKNVSEYLENTSLAIA